jgi:hypothetical protein
VLNKFFRRHRPEPRTPRYYLYLSSTKVTMLYSQIPPSLLRSLETEVKAGIGVLEATVKVPASAEQSDMFSRAAVVAEYIEKNERVGTIAQPERYIKDVASLKYGIVSEYAADIAFFGGNLGETKVGLIGSSGSMVGETEKNEAGHAPFYYTLKFLRRMAEDETTDSVRDPDYYDFRQAYEIALNAASLEARVEFLGRLLYREPGLIIITPIYVALAD